ncbi:MAG: hypothetical protein K2M84_05970 [Anaeroplasmataceae bacterium]|nr:hypothetical protein [Anaeroplasmataceae bacterium]MDE7385287.1 hypothetical protein [Anaeroplasmataceae bacterium]
MRKNSGISRLTKLYLSYHLNKVTFIVFGIVLFIWCLVLLLNTGLPLEMDKYVTAPSQYHLNYLEQSLFFLEIIDGVLVAFLVGAELSTLALFDPMFVPNTSRIKIIICKLLANFIILMGIVIFQILLMDLIGVSIFPSFVIKYTDLLLILYFALPMIELLLFGELLAILINSYFIPILIFIIHILSVILFRVDKWKTTLSLFLPKIEFISSQPILNGNLFIYSGICIVLGLGVALLFQKKDISNT